MRVRVGGLGDGGLRILIYPKPKERRHLPILGDVERANKSKTDICCKDNKSLLKRIPKLKLNIKSLEAHTT